MKLLIGLIVAICLSGMLALQQDEEPKKKILIYGTAIASHALVNMGIALDIAKTNKYNVTYLVPEMNTDNLQKNSKANGINVVVFPFYDRLRMDSFPTREMRHSFQVDEVFNIGREIIEQLKREKFDMIITEFQPQHYLLATYLEIPIYIQQIGSMEPMQMDKFSIASVHSSQINQFRHQFFKRQPFNSIEDIANSMIIRIQNFLSIIGSRYEWYEKETFYEYMLKNGYPDQYMDLIYYNQKIPNLTITYSLEGLLNPAVSVPQNHKYLYAKYKQQQNKDQELSPRVKHFLGTYDKVIYICFGTQFYPQKFELLEIIRFMKSNKKYGFLIIIRDGYFEKVINNLVDFKELMEKPIKNILVQKWVPQPKVLAHPNVKVFFTHGGKNSMIEGIENAKPFIVFPLNQNDQNFFCEYAHMQHIGQCIFKMSMYNLAKALSVIEENDYYQEKMQNWQEVLLKAKIDEEQDINYWIDYCFEVGTDHLMDFQYRKMTYFELNDFDVHIIFYVWILVMIYAIIRLSPRVYKRAKEEYLIYKAKTQI